MNQEWFEMLDIRRKNYSKSVWIPLRAAQCNESEIPFGYNGYKETFFGSGSVAVPAASIAAAKTLGWMDIGIRQNHSGWVDGNIYTTAETFVDCGEGFDGVCLVLEQVSQDESANIWHLNQDLVITLGLIRENDSWICPKDGYAEVARLKMMAEKPVLMEIKAEYLKDYLCARNMALYMTQYHSRNTICNDAAHITWLDGKSTALDDAENWNWNWEGGLGEIHEGGMPFGGKTHVTHIMRTDIDTSEDVPDMADRPTDKNTQSESWTRGSDGRKLYRISGELWRNEMIMPGKHSPRVRGDSIPSTAFFFVDAEGNKSCGQDLIESRRWLWFKPEVMTALCDQRGGHLSFCTAQTGQVACSSGCGVHFGVNELGLINAYAKDIGLLPEWQQLLWAGYNVSPDGGVSAELLAAQAKGKPAATQAPEEYLPKVIEAVNTVSKLRLGITIFRDHSLIPELLERTHRFRSVDEKSFFELAKDLARLTADSINAKDLQSIAPPPEEERWGSLRSLEELLVVVSEIPRDEIKKVTASLVGVYELRHADAHLPRTQLEDSFKLLNLDRSLPFVHQGHDMLHRVVSSIHCINAIIARSRLPK